MTSTKMDQKTIDAVRARVTDAFKSLRKSGYIARQGFMCCGSCAGAAIGEQFTKSTGLPADQAKAVFYHKQSKENFDEGHPLFVAWQGDAAEISAAFTSAGLEFNHDGSAMNCFEITGLSTELQ